MVTSDKNYDIMSGEYVGPPIYNLPPAPKIVTGVLRHISSVMVGCSTMLTVAVLSLVGSYYAGILMSKILTRLHVIGTDNLPSEYDIGLGIVTLLILGGGWAIGGVLIEKFEDRR